MEATYISCSHCGERVQAYFRDPMKRLLLVASSHMLLPKHGGNKKQSEPCPGSGKPENIVTKPTTKVTALS